MLEYKIEAKRLDSHGSIARCKDADLLIDTDPKGRTDAFNPDEIFVASIAACILKGIERVTPLIKFELRGVEVRLVATRQDAPSKMASVRYEIVVDTDESEQRLELLHTNVRKHGTIFNTVVDAVGLAGVMRRRQDAFDPKLSLDHGQ